MLCHHIDKVQIHAQEININLCLNNHEECSINNLYTNHTNKMYNLEFKIV